MTNLLDGASANGNGDALFLKSNTEKIRAGSFWVVINSGTATVKLQESPDNVNWFDISGTTFSSDAAVTVEYLMPYIRAVVSNASGADVDAGFTGA